MLDKAIENMIVNTQDIEKLLTKDEIFQKIHAQYGEPPNWQRPQGFVSLCQIILEQQVSISSAKAHFDKLDTYVQAFTPKHIAALSDEEMRACHISRQKTKYIKGLANAILEGTLHVEKLPLLSEAEVREKLTALKGIGNWTADIYLQLCLQSKDIFPLGDLALVNAMKEFVGDKSKDELIAIGERWKPFRSLATFFFWHYYLKKRNRKDEMTGL